MEYKKARIISNEKIVDNIYRMICEDDSSVKAGQFYMLKGEGTTFLPRPISVCEKNSKTVTFLYAVVGKGTLEFSNLKAGDFINLTGPIGNGFDLDSLAGERIALVTGGIGIAPLLEVSKRLRQINSDLKIELFAGFRDETYLLDEFSMYVSKINISTDSGKYGHKGFVTEIFSPQDFDCVLCCGPEVMMKRVVAMCKEVGTPVLVSMEKHMACGVGACLGCVCKTTGGVKRTCVDGPVFDGSLIEF